MNEKLDNSLRVELLQQPDLVLDQALTLSQDLARTAILDFVLGNPANDRKHTNGANSYLEMEKRWLGHLLGESGSQRLNMVFYTGFSGAGDSTLNGEMIGRLFQKYARAKQAADENAAGSEIDPNFYYHSAPSYPRIYTLGLKTGIVLCRRTGDIKESVSQGALTVKHYLKVGQRLDGVRGVALDYLSGLLFEEGVAESEMIGRDGENWGVTRANLKSLREITRRRLSTIDLVAVYSDLETLRKRVGFRMDVIKAGPNSVLELQQERGIIEDRPTQTAADREEVFNNTYLRTGNAATLEQQLADWYEVYQMILKNDPLIDPETDSNKNWLEYQKEMELNPAKFTEALRDVYYPKLSESIFGQPRSEHATMLYNPDFNDQPNHKPMKYWECRGLADALDVAQVLKRVAKRENNSLLNVRLKSLGIL